MAAENPIPLLAWVAAAAVGGLTAGIAAAAVVGRKKAPPVAPPAISPSQPPPSTVSTAAERAMQAASQAAPATAARLTSQEASAQASTQAAAQAAAEGAANVAALKNTTYELDMTAASSQPVLRNILLKVGDTIRIVPSYEGSPPFALMPVYTMSQGGSSILNNLGSTNNIDATYAAVSIGTCTLTIQFKGGPANAVFFDFEVTITVSTA